MHTENDDINEQLGFTRDDDEPFVVYDVLSPGYPTALLCSLESSAAECGVKRAPGSLIVVSAGVRRFVASRSCVFLGGLLGPRDVGRRFGQRAVATLTHPGSRAFVLYEKLGSSVSPIADTASRIGFRVFEMKKYGANKDIVCIGSSEMLSSLDWLEDACPTTGSFVLVCRKPSCVLDDLEDTAHGGADPYDVLASFRKQMCSDADAASERLGMCEALAYFDGPDGDNLVILTSTTCLDQVHAGFREIARDLGIALYFADSPCSARVLDGFRGWLTWRPVPTSWKRVTPGCDD